MARVSTLSLPPLALLLLLLLRAAPGSAISERDAPAFTAFFQGLTSTGTWGWDGASDPCDDFIVVCDPTTDNVVEMQMFSAALEGTIASEIGLLTDLRSLNLGLNSFSGTVPSELGNLQNLVELSLDQNPELGGVLPMGLFTHTYEQLFLTDRNAICNFSDYTAFTLNNDFFFGSLQKPECVTTQALNCDPDIYGRTVWGVGFLGMDMTGTCVPGWTGSPKRRCLESGQWSQTLGSHCSPLSCEAETVANAFFPTSGMNTIVAGTCPEGFRGTPKRYCNGIAQWSEVSGGCFPLAVACPQQTYGSAFFLATAGGSLAIGSCLPGYDGIPRRLCNFNGTWSQTLSTYCFPVPCPEETVANAVFPATGHGASAQGVCAEGFAGAPTRYCNGGVWNDPAGIACAPFRNCPAQVYGKNVFEETAPGVLAAGTCVAGWTGTPRRLCRADGTWATSVNNLCTRA